MEKMVSFDFLNKKSRWFSMEKIQNNVLQLTVWNETIKTSKSKLLDSQQIITQWGRILDLQAIEQLRWFVGLDKS